ncbi:MAG: decarboxylating NADP(+)-dependent phosphogluconate dehydrogenase [Thermoanaerobaculia bacterium]
MSAQFGLIGLGVMGQNLALNFDDHGVSVAIWNLEGEWVERFLRGEGAGRRFSHAATLEDLVTMLERPRRILVMIKAGAPVDQTLARLLPLLEEGDMVIDGGNSHYADTERRQAEASARGVYFVGCGVSGGEEGARRGPSLMPGGDPLAWEPLKPTLEAIAARSEWGPCVSWIGRGGAGHFVKMVHNGIEYGDMQAIAEAWDLLRRRAGLKTEELAAIFERWNRGPLESFLVEITGRIAAERDPETGRPLVDLILDQAGQKGTGRWTARVAIELGIAAPTLAAAVDARVLSSLKAERVDAAAVLEGPASPSPADVEVFVASVEKALLATRICAYAQGFALIAAASAEWSWDIRLIEVARVWTAGCIIRARLLADVMNAYAGEPPPNLLVADGIRQKLAASHTDWRKVIAEGAAAGIPLPAMSSALAYYDSYRTATLPQNLTQAQRDLFGAHTYRRIDRPNGEPEHTDWK